MCGQQVQHRKLANQSANTDRPLLPFVQKFNIQWGEDIRQFKHQTLTQTQTLIVNSNSNTDHLRILRTFLTFERLIYVGLKH